MKLGFQRDSIFWSRVTKHSRLIWKLFISFIESGFILEAKILYSKNFLVFIMHNFHSQSHGRINLTKRSLIYAIDTCPLIHYNASVTQTHEIPQESVIGITNFFYEKKIVNNIEKETFSPTRLVQDIK